MGNKGRDAGVVLDDDVGVDDEGVDGLCSRRGSGWRCGGGGGVLLALRRGFGDGGGIHIGGVANDDWDRDPVGWIEVADAIRCQYHAVVLVGEKMECMRSPKLRRNLVAEFSLLSIVNFNGRLEDSMIGQFEETKAPL